MSRRGAAGGPSTPSDSAAAGADGSNGGGVVRLLVLGDSGVGKSRLVQRIVARLGGECLAASDTTVGSHLEAVVWPAVTPPLSTSSSHPPHGHHTVLELLEVGGNRGFSAAARRPFYMACPAATTTMAGATSRSNGGSSTGIGADGVLLVYSERTPASKRSLLSWYRELTTTTAAADGDGSPATGVPPPFLVVGLGGSGTADPQRSWFDWAAMHLVARGGRRGQAVVRALEAIAATPAFATLRQVYDAVVSFAFGVSLLVLSLVLLGPARMIWPWGNTSEHTVVAALEQASDDAVNQARRPPASPSGDESTSLRQPSGSRSAVVVGALAPAPFRGHSSDVNLSTPADFDATGEGVMEFIADVVRATTNASGAGFSSGSSSGSRR